MRRWHVAALLHAAIGLTDAVRSIAYPIVYAIVGSVYHRRARVSTSVWHVVQVRRQGTLATVHTGNPCPCASSVCIPRVRRRCAPVGMEMARSPAVVPGGVLVMTLIFKSACIGPWGRAGDDPASGLSDWVEWGNVPAILSERLEVWGYVDDLCTEGLT